MSVLLLFHLKLWLYDTVARRLGDRNSRTTVPARHADTASFIVHELGFVDGQSHVPESAFQTKRLIRLQCRNKSKQICLIIARASARWYGCNFCN